MKKCITTSAWLAWILWSQGITPSGIAWDPWDTFTTKLDCIDYAEQVVTNTLQKHPNYSRGGPIGYIIDKNDSVSFSCFPSDFDPRSKK